MIYIGVDPGKKGGFAIIHIDLSGKQQVDVYPWDDDAFVREMAGWRDDFAAQESGGAVACVEKVGAMHGQGVRSMFTFGKSAGFIEGVLAALGIGYQLIPPKTWKAEFGLNSDKADSIAVCKRLFPGVNLLPNERCRKDSDGMAEALLMAEYARRKM